MNLYILTCSVVADYESLLTIGVEVVGGSDDTIFEFLGAENLKEWVVRTKKESGCGKNT